MLRQIKAAFYPLIIVLIVTLAYSCNSEERNSNKVALLPKDSTTIQLPHSTAPTGMQYIESKELGTHLMQIDFQVQATPEEQELYEGPVIKYGIWGHDLSDLDLSSIEVYLGKNGFIYLSLGVESL